ncbi:hypothetical protein [Sphaerisporangium sp. TRM90804]|uniref:hypothetical protein n=1 Tax=Sphaerisporangium sp. TRM90804 TaxID=3031113 RepID=UPI002447AAB0|nr:hypothetical protein [Sphaerisporangium sp. TRM90804]MDH2424469.1 hypothetical protein [Sphaerisporangium sp. TRM90804]
MYDVTAGERPRRRRSPAFTVALTLVALSLMAIVVPNVGPVLRAARADGSPGVFTARSVACIQHPGHESCTWNGEFRSEDGTIHRPAVAFYGADREMLREGQRTLAFDVGRPNYVYGPGGSNEWVFTALILLAGLAVLGFLYVPPLLRLLRAPAARRAAEHSAPRG